MQNGVQKQPTGEREKIFTQIPLKDGSTYEPEQDFIAELDTLYYGVETELSRMRLWCLADPSRRKTRRGVKRFIFMWVCKTCQLRPKATPRKEMPATPVSTESLESRKSHLAELKGALCK